MEKLYPVLRSKLMIKFKDQDGLETEQSYDLDAKTSVEDLQEILKAAVQNLDQDNEYSFYHNTFEVSKILAWKISTKIAILLIF